MRSANPLASLSLDVDNLWAYLKTHGCPGWERRPSYLRDFFPPVLDALDQLGLRITFFIVGADADREENADVLRAVTRRGHEVGNHSFHHEPWQYLSCQERLEEEISRAEAAIHLATGQSPVGFRGPSYSWSPDLLRLLSDRGYLYDASTLPTYLGPLARAYASSISSVSEEEMAERGTLFGTFRDGLRPLKPYRWRLDGERTLLEMPVTTFPVVKTPFHLSYLLYLTDSRSIWRWGTCARRSPRAASPEWSRASCSTRSTSWAATRSRSWPSFRGWIFPPAGSASSPSESCACSARPSPSST